MVIIEELNIKNCFSLQKLALRFENKCFVTIFNCKISYELKRILILAIGPFLSKKYMRQSLQGNVGVDPDESNVRIKFTIPKNEADHNICIEAMRTNKNPNLVYYYFNGEQYIDHIHVFYERCQIDVTSFYPLLNEVFSNENINLMHIWITNPCPLHIETEKSYELFADYLDVFHTRPQSERTDIVKLTESILIIDKDSDILKKRSFVVVANEIGKIFNYLTFSKYTVKFFIPLAGENIKIQELQWDDMDLNKVETYIQKENVTNLLLWNKAEPGLKYLLKISQLLALAKHLGQKCIIIENTIILQNYQNQEMIREAILENAEIKNESNWKNKNFLERIVNVCNEMELMLFINYHGGLPLPPKDANIIMCQDFDETNDTSIYVSRDMESMSLQEFVCLFTPCNSF